MANSDFTLTKSEIASELHAISVTWTNFYNTLVITSKQRE